MNVENLEFLKLFFKMLELVCCYLVYDFSDPELLSFALVRQCLSFVVGVILWLGRLPCTINLVLKILLL